MRQPGDCRAALFAFSLIIGGVSSWRAWDRLQEFAYGPADLCAWESLAVKIICRLKPACTFRCTAPDQTAVRQIGGKVLPSGLLGFACRKWVGSRVGRFQTGFGENQLRC
jgi:hypothetical protein